MHRCSPQIFISFELKNLNLEGSSREKSKSFKQRSKMRKFVISEGKLLFYKIILA